MTLLKVSLEHLGYRHVESVTGINDWLTLTDDIGHPGLALSIPSTVTVSSELLGSYDDYITQSHAAFLIIIHSGLSASNIELLETWDFPCAATVISHDELERSTKDDVVEELPPENPADLLKKKNESELASLERLRPRLLDLTLRNPLLNFRSGGSRTVPIVDELPRLVASTLLNEKSMRLDPAPEESEDAAKPKRTGKTKGVGRLTVDAAEQLSLSFNEPTAEPDEASFEVPADPGTGPVAARYRDRSLQTPLKRAPLLARLNSIYRDQETAIESTGTNPLHIALGFLHWYENPAEQKPRLAPLLLIPVFIDRTEVTVTVPLRPGDDGWDPAGPTLQKKKIREFQFEIALTGEGIVANECLLRKLASNFGLILPSLNTSDADGASINPEEYFRSVATVIGNYTEDKRWKVRREIALGFFSFVKLLEWQDLDPTQWKSDPNGLLERILTAKEQKERSLPTDDVQADDFHLSARVTVAHEADSSQTAVLVRALEGEDLVVRGPPGTGKTQTITNLIAGAISSGKSVLFVAEKMAALSAAREKLEQAGLSEFCLELHSHKATASAALKEIRLRLARTEAAVANLERVRAAVRPKRDALNAYAALMAKQVGHADQRIEQVLWHADHTRHTLSDFLSDEAQPPVLTLPPGQVVTVADYDKSIGILRSVAELAKEAIPQRASAWSDFRPSHALGDEVRLIEGSTKRMVEALTVAVALQDGVPDYPGWSLPCATWFDQVNKFARVVDPPVTLMQAVATSALAPDRAIIERAVDHVFLLRQRRQALADILIQIAENGDYERVSKALDYLTTRRFSQERCVGLVSLLASCEQLAELVGTVRTSTATLLTHIGLSGTLTWRHVPVALSLVRQMNTPSEMVYLHVRMMRGAVRSAIAAAQAKYDAIVDDRNKLEKVFVIDDMPSDEDFRQLRQVFREQPRRWLAFFGIGQLAAARRRVKRFIRSQEIFATANMPLLLDKALAWRAKLQAFESDKRIENEVGAHFAGMKTPWVSLVTASTLVEDLSTVFGVESTRACLEGISTRLNTAPELGALEESLTALIAQRAQAGIAWGVLSVAAQHPAGELTAIEQELQTTIEELRIVIGFYRERDGLSLATASVAELTASLGEVAAVRDLQRVVVTDTEAQRVLGAAYDGESTNLAPIEASLAWVDSVILGGLGVLGTWVLNEQTVKRMADARRVLGVVGSELQHITESCAQIAKYGQCIEHGAYAVQTCRAPFSELLTTWKAALAGIDHLPGWSRWCTLAARGQALGISPLIWSAEIGCLRPDGLIVAYDADVYGRLAQTIFQSHPQLRTFERAAFDASRDEFREQDRSLLQIGRECIARDLLNMPVPKGESGNLVGELTQLHLIEHELNKDRRHIPIRQLVHRAGAALQALTPCLMMSPLSVAQFLPRVRGMFDLVIMDEASQIRPEDAFGALLRAKQAVIVGDEKQMPPSYLFDTVGSSGDGAHLLAGNSASILDLAHTSLTNGRTSLKWHYRSQHESLIQYSNHKYYDNELVIFPSRFSKGGGLGIKLEYVPDGRFLGGLNKVEANVVAKQIIDHALVMVQRKPANRDSLLVVTMNSEQCKLVRDLIDSAALSDDRISEAIRSISEIPERLMIKNLENVQGDERDRVIIACTYGKDPQSGVVRQAFGPINQLGGERRLNVLFSRAKKSITVISSMMDIDIKPTSRSARGVHDLKDYLTFAATGGIPDRGVRTRREPDSDFERAVGAIIERLGYQAVYQVGVANYFVDIGVVDTRNPDEYLLGVECDGATYHSSRCARDRDRLRQDIIESRGWQLHRIWSTSWFRDRFSEERRLKLAIEAAVMRRGSAFISK